MLFASAWVLGEEPAFRAIGDGRDDRRQLLRSHLKLGARKLDALERVVAK